MPSAVELAGSAGLPVLFANRISGKDTIRQLNALLPDLVLVACFDQLLPSAFLALPRYGCYNLHPSLLPAYRGPDPLFWQFHAGERNTGITLHRMSAEVDAGDILLQHAVDLPGGITGPDAEVRLAYAGAELTLEALPLFTDGVLPLRPQNEALSSRQGPPGPDAFRLSTRWTAERAFNFMRGTEYRQCGYTAQAGRERLVLRRAEGFEPDATLGSDFCMQGDEVLIQFSPGVLRARMATGP
jgi:methionyl-tRNA formyltransferase